VFCILDVPPPKHKIASDISLVLYFSLVTISAEEWAEFNTGFLYHCVLESPSN